MAFERANQPAGAQFPQIGCAVDAYRSDEPVVRRKCKGIDTRGFRDDQRIQWRQEFPAPKMETMGE
jgi:hypothetical protein